MDKNIASLVEITDAILRGDYNRQASAIDAEGLLSTLAQKINAMMVNLKTIEEPLTAAGHHAPTAIHQAHNVVELMAQSTEVVLDKSDKLLTLAEQLETLGRETGAEPGEGTSPPSLPELKAAVFDIIASQSYQDAARQKMERLIDDLNQIRAWLIEALVVLNINRDGSPENIQQKTELLRGMTQPADAAPLEQNLIDDLMAEFGL